MIGAPAQVIYDCGSVAPVVASKGPECRGDHWEGAAVFAARRGAHHCRSRHLAPAKFGRGVLAALDERRHGRCRRDGLLHAGRRRLGMIRLNCTERIGNDRMRRCKNWCKDNRRRDKAEHVTAPVAGQLDGQHRDGMVAASVQCITIATTSGPKMSRWSLFTAIKIRLHLVVAAHLRPYRRKSERSGYQGTLG